VSRNGVRDTTRTLSTAEDNGCVCAGRRPSRNWRDQQGPLKLRCLRVTCPCECVFATQQTRLDVLCPFPTPAHKNGGRLVAGRTRLCAADKSKCWPSHIPHGTQTMVVYARGTCACNGHHIDLGIGRTTRKHCTVHSIHGGLRRACHVSDKHCFVGW
jgi:hypothetical protein